MAVRGGHVKRLLWISTFASLISLATPAIARSAQDQSLSDREIANITGDLYLVREFDLQARLAAIPCFTMAWVV
jgi:hypothetical protein